MKNFVNILTLIIFSFSVFAQIPDAPKRTEGDGPYNKLIIRGVTLVNSTGAPPIGPIDIVVEQNIIKEIKQVGYPGVPIDPKRRPKAEKGDKE